MQFKHRYQENEVHTRRTSAQQTDRQAVSSVANTVFGFVVL